MASRGRQTFNKRLKEQQRKEKQQEKFAKRQQRKVEKDDPSYVPTDDIEVPEDFELATDIESPENLPFSTAKTHGEL